MSSLLRTSVAFACLIAVWWSMADLAFSSGVIQSGVRDVFVWREPPPSDGLIYFDSHGSECCRDFSAGFGLSIFVTAFSAIPMALLAFALSWRSPLPSATLQPLARAALILQGASIAVNSLLTMMFLTQFPTELFSPSGWIFVTGVIAGLMAIRPWYRLSRAMAPGLAGHQ